MLDGKSPAARPSSLLLLCWIPFLKNAHIDMWAQQQIGSIISKVAPLLLLLTSFVIAKDTLKSMRTKHRCLCPKFAARGETDVSKLSLWTKRISLMLRVVEF